MALAMGVTSLPGGYVGRTIDAGAGADDKRPPHLRSQCPRWTHRQAARSPGSRKGRSIRRSARLGRGKR